MAAVAIVLLASGWSAPAAVRAPIRYGVTQCCSPPGDPDIPASELAMAWKRDEQAQKLCQVLKGCSLYLVGLGPKKLMVGQVLARRLQAYRCYDVGTLMCSTYRALSGGSEDVSLEQLMQSEPLSDVQQLADLILREVQPFTRSVVVTWDGAIKPADYMIMQQGVVVHLDFDLEAEDVILPTDNAEETFESWCDGHKKADLTVSLVPDMAADDAAFKTIDAILEFIEANPAKSEEWKAKADAKLQTDGDGSTA